MDVTFEFPDAFEFAEMMATSPEVVDAEMVAATDRVAVYGHSVTVEGTPVGVTGDLRRRNQLVKTQITSYGVVGGWENTLEYAPYVEYGTRPHYPPLSAIWAWAKKKGVDPFALQQSIGMWGTEAHPFMAPGKFAAESRLRPEFEGAIKRIVKALGG